jgi:DNA-binding LytR/AlgR family response regulator
VTGLRLLAVDDEEPALDDLSRLLEGVAGVDRARSGSEALRCLNGAVDDYDAIFLDVRMPGLDGMELARVLGRFASPPAIVFVSAHRDTAVDAFELGVLDFLVKPVGRGRLERALAKVAGSQGSGVAPDPGGAEEILAVDSLHGAKRLIARSSVLYLRAQGDYVRVVTDESRFLMRGGLSDIAARWEPHGFARVHRQYAVNLRRAEELRPRLNGTATLVFPGDRSVPVARRRIAELRRRLNL